MKTIAATALFLTFVASAFAAEPQKPQTQEAKKSQAPIVLTIAQLDGVTAGARSEDTFTLTVDWGDGVGETDSTISKSMDSASSNLAQFAINGNS